MPVGVRKGQLTKQKLADLLNIKLDDKKNKLELLKLALEKQKISLDVFTENLPTIESTIKSYLYSVITDEKMRSKIETYVLQASELYIRGTYIANLIAIDIFGPIQHVKLIPKYNFMTPHSNLYNLIENDQFKQCFLPERWPSRLQDRLEPIHQVLHGQHNELLVQMLPNWLDLMSTSGWDNAINRMYTKYRANIENHIIVHLPENIKKYIHQVQLHTDSTNEFLVDLNITRCRGIDTCNKYLYQRFTRPVSPMTIHNDDFEFFMNLREFFNMKLKDYFPKTLEFNIRYFEFYMFLVNQGITNGIYLPISNLGRKYCYIDAKIIQYMFPDHFKQKKKELNRDPILHEILDLNETTFKMKRKKLRKQQRKSKKGKIRKKWSRNGHSQFPKNSKVYSIETDGIGISICIHKAIKINPIQHKQDQDIQTKDKPVVIGMDLGRAKAYAAAISLDPIKKPETLTFTRRKYYYEIKHRIRKKFEQTRNMLAPIQTAHIALSQNNGIQNLNAYLVTLKTHYTTLKSEFLINKERALWRMRLYRLKTRSIDNAVQRLFNKAKGRPIILGVGDAKFPSTGPGEKSMPTTQFVRAILKGKYRYHNKVKLLNINEFRTTLCCCACSNITSASGRRLRLCTHCIEPNDKLRDRDVSAARNILWLTQCEFLGLERPNYLCRPKTTS